MPALTRTWRRLGAALALTAASAGAAAADADTDTPAPPAPTCARSPELAVAAHLTGRTAELLRVLPGLTSVSEAGGARADLPLVRGQAGDDALDVVVDGVSLAQPSHVLGHGLVDSHGLLPSLVADAQLVGAGRAAGDPGRAAGAVLQVTTCAAGTPTAGAPAAGALRARHPDEVTASLAIEPGRFSPSEQARRLSHRWTALTTPTAGPGRLVLAAEWGIADGAFVHPQRHRRGVLWTRWSHQFGGATLDLGVHAITDRWAESGLLSREQVAAGFLTEWSAADATQGGDQARLRGWARAGSDDHARVGWRATLAHEVSSFRLFANQTLYAADAEAGDQREFLDDRSATTVRTEVWRRQRWRRAALRSDAGVEVSLSSAALQIWHTQRRARIDRCFADDNPCLDALVGDRRLSAWLDQRARRGPLTLAAGVRLDQLTWSVDDEDPETGQSPATRGGDAARARLIPVGEARWQVSPAVTLTARARGQTRGTHALAAVDRSAFAALARIWTSELSVDVAPDATLAAGLTGWHVREDRWLAWDAMTTSASLRAGAIRTGADAWLRWRPASALVLVADLSAARVRARAPDAAVEAEVPRQFGSVAAQYRRGRGLVTTRVRALGARLAGTTGDGTRLGTAPATLVDLAGSWTTRWLTISIGVTNLLDQDWRERALVRVTRPSRRADLVDGVIESPGAPRTVVLTVGASR